MSTLWKCDMFKINEFVASKNLEALVVPHIHATSLVMWLLGSCPPSILSQWINIVVLFVMIKK